MKAKLNRKYELEIINPCPVTGDLELNFTFSRKKYPRLTDFLNDAAMHRIPVEYEDETQKRRILIVGYSGSATDFLAEDIRDEDIQLREEIYGREASRLAPEFRREYVLAHFYGKMKIKVID